MRFNTCLSACVLLAMILVPGRASSETLEEALTFAYTSNPTLLAKRAKLRATDELVPQALSNWRPSVTVTGSAGYSNLWTNDSSDGRSVNQTQVARPASAAVSVNQPLYRGGRTEAQTEQAEAQVRADRADLTSTEQTVLLNVVSAYANVVLDRAVVDLNKNNEQLLERELQATQDRFRVGEVTRTDVSQSEARLSAAQAGLRAAEGDLSIAIANYTTVVGHAPGGTAFPPSAGELPRSLDSARAMAQEDNPNIQSAQYSYEAAEHGVDLVFGELLPQVSLNASAGRDKDYNGPYIFEREARATVDVTVPIYQQGQEYSRLRQQKHLAGEARTNIDVTRRDTAEETARAWENLQTAKARTSSYEDEVKAQTIALEGVQKEAEVGSRTVLDVLNAHQELLTASVDLATAQRDELVAGYTLKSAIGQLNARNLSLPVEIYDPVKHYEDVRDQWIGTSTSPSYGESAP